jgi:putative flippase GtrA
MRGRLLRLRWIRFLLSGALVGVVAVALTVGLHTAGLGFQVAFLVSYVTGVALHFALHRHFTFASSSGYALEPGRQAQRFVVTTVGQYVFVAAGVAVLSPLLGVPSLVVYLTLVAVLSIGNFLLMRTHVFHAHVATSAVPAGDGQQRPAER